MELDVAAFAASLGSLLGTADSDPAVSDSDTGTISGEPSSASVMAPSRNHSHHGQEDHRQVDQPCMRHRNLNHLSKALADQMNHLPWHALLAHGGQLHMIPVMACVCVCVCCVCVVCVCVVCVCVCWRLSS